MSVDERETLTEKKIIFEGAEELGFSAEEHAYFLREARKILNQSPSDAEIAFWWEKTDHLFSLRAKISCNQGPFKAEVTGENPIVLFSDTQEALMGSLSAWKSERSFNPSGSASA